MASQKLLFPALIFGVSRGLKGPRIRSAVPHRGRNKGPEYLHQSRYWHKSSEMCCSDWEWMVRHPSMYGPPPGCKRKMRGTRLVCANVCGLHWSEKTPGHDGMRYALFPFINPVLEDFGRMRVSRAPDLTVVPSHSSPANLAGNHKLLSCDSFKPRPVEEPDRLPPSHYRPSHARQLIGYRHASHVAVSARCQFFEPCFQNGSLLGLLL